MNMMMKALLVAGVIGSTTVAVANTGSEPSGSCCFNTNYG